MSRQKISFFINNIFTINSCTNLLIGIFPGSKWDSVSPESLNVNSKNVQTLIDISFDRQFNSRHCSYKTRKA
jgi:hypothetical protein